MTLRCQRGSRYPAISTCARCGQCTSAIRSPSRPRSELSPLQGRGLSVFWRQSLTRDGERDEPGSLRNSFPSGVAFTGLVGFDTTASISCVGDFGNFGKKSSSVSCGAGLRLTDLTLVERVGAVAVGDGLFGLQASGKALPVPDRSGCETTRGRLSPAPARGGLASGFETKRLCPLAGAGVGEAAKDASFLRTGMREGGGDRTTTLCGLTAATGVGSMDASGVRAVLARLASASGRGEKGDAVESVRAGLGATFTAASGSW